MLRSFLLAMTLGAIAIPVWAGELTAERLQNWHHWRGPHGDGVAPQANPPIEWNEQKNIKWKVELPGKGSASPIVWNDRIFILTAIPTEDLAEQEAASEAAPGGGRGFRGSPPPDSPYQFVVLCLDRNTGATLWKQIAKEEVPHEGLHATNTFASGSPITDGKYLYASFGSRGIFCYDLDGNLQWERDLGDMETRNGFGEGSSPALYGDTLVVNWDHEGPSFITALNARTGETRWQVERDERTTWATPLITEFQGRAQVITNGSTRVRSYDLKTGELIWECGGQAGNPIPTPIRRNDLVYCMTGFRGYAVYAIPLSATGDITGSDQVAWYRDDTGPYVSSPVLYKELLYVTKSRDAILSCLDPDTGETVYGPERLPGLQSLYASPVAAADRVYILSREGATVVLEHGRELKVIATNQLEEGIDASPALVGNQMFVRGEKHLYCIEEQPGPAASR